MTVPSPVAVQVFKELKAANRALLVAMAREKRARAALGLASAGLVTAKRNVQLLLQAVQPELPSVGEFEQDIVAGLPAAVDVPPVWHRDVV